MIVSDSYKKNCENLNKASWWIKQVPKLKCEVNFIF